jgi:glycosyltransferase involved in cell wall biosynthesis
MPGRVTFVSNGLSLGGTEKGLVSFATRLRGSGWDVRAVAVSGLGPRAAELETAGVPVGCAEGEESRLAELLAGAEIVHVFRHGAAEPIVPAACRRAGVPHLVETNIFAHVDRSADSDKFACHLFLSIESVLAYRRRARDHSPGFHRRHRALSAPIEHEELRALAPEPREAKRLLGLDPDRPVVGRVGRDADLKWRNLLVDMAPPLVELVPDVQLLYVGATPAKVERLRKLGMLERASLHDPSPDPARLATFYAACDVFASAAEIGESQGLGLGEAMALGVPVVTCSTPWADNAQVQFVEHGKSGWFASHPRSFAEAVADLLLNPGRRDAFGEAGRAEVELTLSAGPLTDQLAGLYRGLLAGERPPPDWVPGEREVEAFAAAYPRLAKAEFRPLALRERGEVMAERGRERLVRSVAAVRARGPAAVRDKLAGLVRSRAG